MRGLRRKLGSSSAVRHMPGALCLLARASAGRANQDAAATIAIHPANAKFRPLLFLGLFLSIAECSRFGLGVDGEVSVGHSTMSARLGSAWPEAFLLRAARFLNQVATLVHKESLFRSDCCACISPSLFICSNLSVDVFSIVSYRRSFNLFVSLPPATVLLHAVSTSACFA